VQHINLALNDLAQNNIKGAEQQTRAAMPNIWPGTMNNGNMSSSSTGA
jgi:hypothetical protein